MQFKCIYCAEFGCDEKCVAKPAPTAPTLTGGSSSYYSIPITNPTTSGSPPYVAECNDIIEALGMSFGLGNVFKAVWRICATKMGRGKPGTSMLYDAEKIEFFGAREVALHTIKKDT